MSLPAELQQEEVVDTPETEEEEEDGLPDADVSAFMEAHVD